MDAIQTNIISMTSRILSAFLADEGAINQVDVLNEVFKLEMTDEAIAGVPSFAEMDLTSADVQAGVFVLKTMRATLLNTNLTAVTKLANLR